MLMKTFFGNIKLEKRPKMEGCSGGSSGGSGGTLLNIILDNDNLNRNLPQQGEILLSGIHHTLCQDNINMGSPFPAIVIFK